jgi:WD40 repeat protein
MLGPQASFGGKDLRSSSVGEGDRGRQGQGRGQGQGLAALSNQDSVDTDGGATADTEPSHAAAQRQLNSHTELLDIKILKDVRGKFLEFGVGDTGDSLKVEDFIDILSAYMPRQVVEKIYKKIDVNDDGFVDWHEFTGFLINADSMKTSTSYGPTYRPAERAAQAHDRHTHRDLIEHLAFSMRPVPMIITGCKDGSISMWNYSDLSYIGSIAHHDKNSIMLSSMVKTIPTAQKAAMKVANGKLSAAAPMDGVCLTSMAALSATGHLCVASADCSFAVYDLGTQEGCGRVNSTGEMLTAMAAFQSLDKRLEVMVPYIITGDRMGYISVIKIDHEFCSSSDAGQKKKAQYLMSKALGAGLDRVRLHTDSVTKLIFLPDMEQIVSASMDGKIKFINMEKMTVYREFSGHGNTGASVHVGVKSFAWAPVQKYVVSVGTDRVILMWDPYTLDVMCKLSGLAAPVMELAIDEKYQQVIASTQKKCIRTWDSVTYEALEPVDDRADYLPVNEISCALYVPELRGMVTAANRLKLYSIEKTAEEGGSVEQDDLTCALFNEVFHQIVIVSNSGKVKVYLSEDGSLVTHFNAQSVASGGEDKFNTPDQDAAAFVKLAAFDGPKRRLIIVTVNNDIQFWNCHNGTNLCVVTPRVPPYLLGQINGMSASSPLNITSFVHASILFPVSASGGGSSRAVSRKHVLLGLQNGAVMGLHEADTLSEDASMLLVRSVTGRGKSAAGRKGGVLDNDESSAGGGGGGGGGDAAGGGIGRRASTRRQSAVPPRTGTSNAACAVLWLRIAAESSGGGGGLLFAGYADGIVILWDVAAGAVVMHMEGDSPGAAFSCMRRRIITSRSRAPPMTIYLEQQRGLAQQRTGQDDLKRLKQAQKAIETREGKTSQAPGDISHYHHSFQTLESGGTYSANTGSAVHTQGSQASSGSRPLNLAAGSKSGSKSLNRPQSAAARGGASNSLVKASSPFGFHNFSRGTVVGVGNRKQSVDDSYHIGRSGINISKAGTNANASTSTSEKVPMSPIKAKPVYRDAIAIDQMQPGGGGRPGGGPAGAAAGAVLDAGNSYYTAQEGALGDRFPSLTQDASFESFEEEYVQRRPFSRSNTPPAAATSGNLAFDAGSRSRAWANESGAVSTSNAFSRAGTAAASRGRDREGDHHTVPYLPIAIYHSVVSLHYRLMFGSCSDGLLRVWDLDCGEVLCSCDLTHSAEDIKTIRAKSDDTSAQHFQHDDSESSISQLSISEKSNHIAGGYDDGLVRIWLMGPHSTGQLRTVTVTESGELAIPPLQYSGEWLAHDTAISGVELISRESTGAGSMSYICTSGQAQGVYLWTIFGKLVGTFGGSEWAIHDSLTWRPKAENVFDLKAFQATHSSSSNSNGEALTPGYEWGQELSRGLKLALYMDKLKTRVHNRQATSAYAMQDGHFSDVQGRHPVLTPVPPAATSRASLNNRSLRANQKHSHGNGDNNTHTNAHNNTLGGQGQTRGRNKQHATLAGKLNMVLTASADSTLHQLMRDSRQESVAGAGTPAVLTALEKLDSVASSANFSSVRRPSHSHSHSASPRPPGHGFAAPHAPAAAGSASGHSGSSSPHPESFSNAKQ